jgi:exosortase/archaeosortase family protein
MHLGGMVRDGKRVMFGLAAGLIVALWLPDWMRADATRLAWLLQPAAWLAGLMMSAPVATWEDGIPVIVHPLTALRVVPGCAGAEFLGLLAGILLWISLRHRPLVALWIAPLAWLLTIIANGIRLAGLLHIQNLMGDRLPAYLHNSLHSIVGVALFLPLLVVASVWWERKVCRVRNNL